ncbi:MAG: glycosyltransferase family 4 protein [Flexibacteraceae bacterium]
MLNLLFPLIATFALAIIAIPLVRQIALIRGWTDKPDGRKIHIGAIPSVGGLGIFISIIPILIYGIQYHDSTYNAWLIGSTLLVITGWADDIFDMPATFKLMVQLAASYLVASAGLRIESLYGILGIYELHIVAQYLLTMIIIAGITNALNLMDGINGLVGGFFIIALVAWLPGLQIHLKFMALAFIGATTTYLYFNTVKKQMFLGDAGSLLIGYTLSVLALHLINNPIETSINNYLPLITSILFWPVADTLRVMLTRIAKGKSPFSPDRTHLHHLVLDVMKSHNFSSLTILLFVVAGAFISQLIELPLTLMLVLQFAMPIVTSMVFSKLKTFKRQGVLLVA